MIWPENESEMITLVERAAGQGSRHFVLNQPWQIGLFKKQKGFDFWAGPFCNLANAAAIECARSLGFNGVIVSPELGRDDYLQLPAESCLPLGVVLSGNWPLCISRSLTGEVKTERPFSSPRAEQAWVSKHGSDYWVYPGWPMDLQKQTKLLQTAGYKLFVHLIEPVPKTIKLKKRPGLWNWNRYYPDYPTALENLRNLLTAARELGIEGFLVTAWGDDGSECLFSLLDPLILAAMEIAEGSGEWEEKWAVISGEPREVVELRKLFGEVDTVVRDWQTRWGIWIPKHLLLKTDIYKIGRRYLPREKFEELEKSLEKVLEKARGLELPPDLEFVKRFYEAVLKVLRGEVSVSDYLSLARIYAELWLRERKREGLDNVVGRFWRAAGIHDLRLLE